jgi:cytochrome c biogenesis protein ResB
MIGALIQPWASFKIKEGYYDYSVLWYMSFLLSFYVTAILCVAAIDRSWGEKVSWAQALFSSLELSCLPETNLVNQQS